MKGRFEGTCLLVLVRTNFLGRKWGCRWDLSSLKGKDNLVLILVEGPWPYSGLMCTRVVKAANIKVQTKFLMFTYLPAPMQWKSCLQKWNHRGTEECLQRKRSGCVASHIQSSLPDVGAVVERGGEGGEGDEENHGGEVGGRAEWRHPPLLLGDNWSHA